MNLMTAVKPRQNRICERRDMLRHVAIYGTTQITICDGYVRVNLPTHSVSCDVQGRRLYCKPIVNIASL